MTASKKMLTTSCVAAALFACTGTLHAGEISGFSWSSGIASVAGVSIVPAAAPNNDDVVGVSPNELFVTQKHYTGVGPVDIEFTVEPTGGTTEYTIYEGVSNSTGFAFDTYRLELGFGMGSDFVQSAPGDGLDFDAPDYNLPTSFAPFFGTVAVAEDVITASGGSLPDGAFSLPYFQFAIDIPDGISSFTLRQVPTAVPEPVSASLMAMLGLGALTRRHRTRA